VHGTLKSGAFASINFRDVHGKTVSGAGVRWTITGTEGEIEVTSPEFPWQFGMPGAKILLRAGEKDEIEEVDFKDLGEKEYVSTMKVPAANVARVYDAFATGKKGRFASFEDAVETHRLLDAVKKGSL
jgi:predicted dehydrogenase